MTSDRQPSPSFPEQVAGFAQSVATAFEPVVEAFDDMARQLADAFDDVFAPILARKKPYETGREVAEIAVENNLTAAERYPVRAETTYEAETFDVQYNDGTGFETFVEYEKTEVADAE